MDNTQKTCSEKEIQSAVKSNENCKSNIESGTQNTHVHSSGGNQYKCPKCEVSYLYQFPLEKHMLIHERHKQNHSTRDKEIDTDKSTGPQTISYKCRFCSNVFDSLLAIKNHVDTHIGEMVSCTKCRMAFNNKIDFDHHVELHRSQRTASAISSQLTESTRERPDSAIQSPLSTLPYCIPNRHENKRHEPRLKSPMIQPWSQTQSENESRAKIKVTERLDSEEKSTPVFYTEQKLHTKTFTEQILLRLIEEEKTDMSRYEKWTTTLPEQCVDENRYQCVFCCRAFESLVDRNTHMGTHVGDRLHRCNKESTHKTSQGHCRIYHFSVKCQASPKPVHTEKYQVYKCPVCSKRFKEEVQLYRHKYTHTHKCTDCNKEFTKTSDFKVHMKTHMGEKPHQCSECYRCYARSSTLKIHMRSHTGERPYTCSECDKQFTVSGHLHEHMMTHSLVRPHKCSVCRNSFRLLSHLKCHMMTHTGVKPYTCSVCDKRFALSGNFKSHMKIHTGEIAHECSVCKKGFQRVSQLNQHLIIHTEHNQNVISNKPHRDTSCSKDKHMTYTPQKGKSKHMCPQCNKGFSRMSSLKRHMKTHIGERPDICPHCGDVFAKPQELANHIKMHVEKDNQATCKSLPNKGLNSVNETDNYHKNSEGDLLNQLELDLPSADPAPIENLDMKPQIQMLSNDAQPDKYRHHKISSVKKKLRKESL